jgi:CBS domain containing-hemolysin-like protein
MSLEIRLALLALLLLLAAFCSSAETALFGLHRVQLRRLKASPHPRARAVLRLLERPAELLAAILVANTLLNIAFTAAMTDLFLDRWAGSPQSATGLATLCASALVIFLGEITPKTLAIRFAEPIARLEARPLRVLLFVLRPLIHLLSRLAHAGLRLIGIRDLTGSVSSLTPGELRALFDEVGEDAVLSEAERRIATRIFEFSSTRAAEVMTPRLDIRSADRRVSREALAEIIRASRHTRIPITDGSLDQIVGYLNAKTFLLNPEASLDDLLQPVLIVPETKRVNEIFHEIQRRRIAMVVVVDEYGHTVGIITKEDLVEEIVGELYDEYDTVERPIVKVGPDRYLVTGQVTVDALAEALGVEIATEAVTLNGLLADLLGDIPAAGDRVEHAGLAFHVLEVRRHRVHRCEVRRLGRAGRGGGEPGAAAGRKAGRKPGREEREGEAGGSVAGAEPGAGGAGGGEPGALERGAGEAPSGEEGEAG